MKLNSPKQIAFIVSLVEHAILGGLVVFTLSTAGFVPSNLIEINLMSLPPGMTSGVNLPSAGLPPQPEKPLKPEDIAQKKEPLPSSTMLSPSEIGVTIESSLFNTLDIISSGIVSDLKMQGGKVGGFRFGGTGIATAKPDNVYVQFSVKSDVKDTMQFAEKDVEKKLDYISWRLQSMFKLKKEQFKAFGFEATPIEYAERLSIQSHSRQQLGLPQTGEKRLKYTVTKSLQIVDLGKRKMDEICEIIDRARQYGAIVVSESTQDLPFYVFSATSKGQGKSKTAQSKGVSKNKVEDESTADKSEFINYHFSEEALEKLVKQAKEAAYKEAKEKVAAVKKVIKFKDSDMDVDFSEKVSSTQTEEGEVTIRVDVDAVLRKNEQKQEPQAGSPGK